MLMPYGPTTLLWVNLFILNLLLGIWILFCIILMPLIRFLEYEDENER
tara:strand:- start:141 stop:284 length:144 start_codon:yes stop_codon:yes gene_type:complete